MLFVFSSVYSQTGFRIKQLANINTHPSTNGNYSALWGWTAPNGREYAILGCYTGTAFIDITDTLNIHEVDFLPTPDAFSFGNTWREMKTYSHYCYIVSEVSGSKIQIVDLQYLPDSIRYVGLSNIPNHISTHSISQSGPYLYLNGANKSLTDGIAVIDLSVNPEVPVLRGKWSNLYVHDSRIINDTIWACNIGDGKVSIIDARNKDSLRNIRSWVNNPLPNSPHNIAFTNDRHYAYVTDELSHPPGKMKIWNVSDLDNITYITSFNSYPFENSMVHNVEIYNNYAFVAYYTAGVKVLNITNPENPVELGWFDTYPEANANIYTGCWGVYYFPSGKIIASDMKRGLFVLRPNLSINVAGMPAADFTVSDLEIIRLDTLTLIDMTEGIPSNWYWTITGPENKTSTLKNPKLAFNSLGQYNVKLSANNLFGTDSISKTNVFRIIIPPLSSFQTVTPQGPSARILISQNDTSRVLFSWNKSYNSPDVYYKIHLKKLFGSSEEYILSGNNGRDTSMNLTRSFLDSAAVRLGLSGDSVRVFYKVKAYNGTDSLSSTNSVTMTLRRISTGIHTVNEFIPMEYKLYNNYPNPFNPSTNINFDLPKSDFINLILYDISGKEVLKLINETLPAGSYKYILNAGNLTSGAYFVKFRSKTYNSAIKIVLIK